MVNESILSKNKKYVIGVSGGPDSMALLDLLRKKGYCLIACLVNYHKREDSDLDYEVVKGYCDRHQIPLAYKEIFEYEKGNFQAQAREMRYVFYEEVAYLYGCEAVLLAHHFDDFLETVLMQKERNQVDGLWGIQDISKYHELTVLRPLLNVSKQDLLDYCHTYHIDYRIDSSNLKSDYTRNYFRNNVLKYYGQKEKDELYDEAKRHNENYQMIQSYCEAWLEEHVVQNRFSLDQFLKAKHQLQLLKMYLFKYSDIPTNRISSKLLNNCLTSMTAKSGNMKINLPVNFLLVKEYDHIYVTRINKDESYCILIEDQTCKDYGYFKTSSEGHDRCGIHLKKGDLPLTIRTYQAGDFIELSYGKKKLSRLFIDAKIPQHLRDKWPVILNAKGEIILVPKIAKNKAYLLEKPTWFVIQ